MMMASRPRLGRLVNTSFQVYDNAHTKNSDLEIIVPALNSEYKKIHSSVDYSSKRGRQEIAMVSVTKRGIIDKASNHSVDRTVEKLKNILQIQCRRGRAACPFAGCHL